MRAPVIARWLLAAGIGASLFANVLAGLSWGLLGAVVAAWPALALVGSYELLMALVRGQATARPGDAQAAAVARVAASAEEAARVALSASIAAGNPISRRALASRFGLTRPAAVKLHRQVTAGRTGTADPGHEGAPAGYGWRGASLCAPAVNRDLPPSSLPALRGGK